MAKTMIRVFLTVMVAIVAVLAGCNAKAENKENENTAAAKASSKRADWPDKLNFAVTGIEGMEELQRRYEPFKKKMEELLDVEIAFFPVSDRVVSATAMEYGQVDLVLAGPSEYAQIKNANHQAELLAGIQRDAYYTVLIVPEKSQIKKIEDLKGKTIAMKDVGSTSGHIGPSAMLLEEGLNLDKDVKIELLGDARIEALKSGDVDALATGVRDYDKMIEEDGKGAYRIIAEGPPLPSDPFVASGKLPKTLRAELKKVLLEHQEAILEAMLASEDNDKYEKAKMIEIQDNDFDAMRETYKVLGIDL